jgi:hypothetical protein
MPVIGGKGGLQNYGDDERREVKNPTENLWLKIKRRFCEFWLSGGSRRAGFRGI